ncbi:MAG: chemotaxis protein CheD [Armatimonadota bacterium]
MLRALGLGSCIGFCVYDPRLKIGCIAHVMLPESRAKDVVEPGKYADTAVPFVIEEMTRRGSTESRLKVALVGGAQLFSFSGPGEKLDVGKKNAVAIKNHISKTRLQIVKEDLGGKVGRTVSLDCNTGDVCVKNAGGVEQFFVCLGIGLESLKAA